MNNIERCLIYDKVNSCESLKELSNIILELADDKGFIQGRTKKFNAKRMSECCKHYSTFFNIGQANVLTREYGIRQQAMYILYYNKDLYE